jgi:hypothetical protein
MDDNQQHENHPVMLMLMWFFPVGLTNVPHVLQPTPLWALGLSV